MIHLVCAGCAEKLYETRGAQGGTHCTNPGQQGAGLYKNVRSRRGTP